MNHNVEFQMVCIDCESLAIRIEDPVRASREAIVYCGDCGAPRGTVGALRDLAVRPNAHAVSPRRSRLSSLNGRSRDDPQSRGDTSEQYSELLRLRRQVQIAESLGSSPRGG
jgi:hypothetical protein